MRTYLFVFLPICYAAASSPSAQSKQLIEQVMEDLRLDVVGNKLIREFLNDDVVIHDDDMAETIYRMSIIEDKVDRSGSPWASESSSFLRRVIQDLISRISDRSILEKLLTKYDERITSFQAYGDYRTQRPSNAVYVTDNVFYWNLKATDVELIIKHAQIMRDLVASKLATPVSKPAAVARPAAPRQRDAASLMMESALAAFEEESANATASLKKNFGYAA